MIQSLSGDMVQALIYLLLSLFTNGGAIKHAKPCFLSAAFSFDVAYIKQSL
jgi:hypothetical protein